MIKTEDVEKLIGKVFDIKNYSIAKRGKLAMVDLDLGMTIVDPDVDPDDEDANPYILCIDLADKTEPVRDALRGYMMPILARISQGKLDWYFAQEIKEHTIRKILSPEEFLAYTLSDFLGCNDPTEETCVFSR